MKDFLKTFLVDPFKSNSIFGYIIGSLMWILVVLLVSLLVWLFVWCVDSSFLDIKEKDGIVTNKYYVPEHMETTYYSNDGVIIPIDTYYGTSYEIEITIDGICDHIRLNQDFWNSIDNNDIIYCKYTNGRLLNSLYIKSIKTK